MYWKRSCGYNKLISSSGQKHQHSGSSGSKPQRRDQRRARSTVLGKLGAWVKLDVPECELTWTE